MKRPAGTAGAPKKRPAKARQTPKRGKPAKQGKAKILPRTMAGVFAAVLRSIDLSAPYRKILYVMRGPPGCGKSTVARKLLARHLKEQGVRWNPSGASSAVSPVSRAFVCSTDDFFTQVDDLGTTKYTFDPRRLGELHQKNQARCEEAMLLSRTPLFVDNTNIALWEMASYVELAARHGYSVMIIGPEELGEGALDLATLVRRCQKRAAGEEEKEIPQSVLERMLNRYEELPEDLRGQYWPADAEQLEPVRTAKRPEPPPRFRYAGLDVEEQILDAMASVELAAEFWEASGADMPPQGERHLLAARGMSVWQVPQRLHVTVNYFGKDTAGKEAASKLLGRSFGVKVTGLVFICGGGLLCATCEFDEQDLATLSELAGDGWRPHITLLHSGSWRAKNSNDVLEGMEKAIRSSTAAAAMKVDSGAVEVDETQLDDATQTDTDAQPQLAAPSEPEALEGTVPAETAGAAPATSCSLLPQDSSRTSEAVLTTPTPGLQVLRGLEVCEKTVDVGIMQFPAVDLGPCEFRLFQY